MNIGYHQAQEAFERAKYILGRNLIYNNCGSESYNNGKI